MKILVLNGSPRKKGTIATLLKAVADGASERHEVGWIENLDIEEIKRRAGLNGNTEQGAPAAANRGG